MRNEAARSMEKEAFTHEEPRRKSRTRLGPGRGIGRAIALKLARHGAKVVVNDLDEGPGDAVAKEIKAAGGDAVAVNGDVAAPGFADRFVGAAIERLGWPRHHCEQRRLYVGLDHPEDER
jgi:NAD(P)-dependent dehydrogenase (short-subunit alcohol dehydrogenase family)